MRQGWEAMMEPLPPMNRFWPSDGRRSSSKSSRRSTRCHLLQAAACLLLLLQPATGQDTTTAAAVTPPSACGPAKCADGCEEGGTFINWEVQLNDNVLQGDILAILIAKTGGNIKIVAPCDGVAVTMQNITKGQAVTFGQEVAVIEPLGVTPPTVAPGKQPWLPALPATKGQVLIRSPEDCTFLDYYIKVGRDVRQDDMLASCIKPGEEADTPIEIRSNVTGKVVHEQNISRGYHLRQGDDMAVITVGEWGTTRATWPSTTSAPSATSLAEGGENVTKGVIIATIHPPTSATTTVPSEGLPKMGIAPKQKLEVSDVNGTFVKWLVDVGDEVKPGYPLCELKVGNAMHIYQATSSGIIAALQQYATFDTPVKAGDHLVVLRPATLATTAPVTTTVPTTSSEAMNGTAAGGHAQAGLTAQTETTTGLLPALLAAASVANGNYAPDGWDTVFRKADGTPDDVGSQPSSVECRSPFDGSFGTFKASVGSQVLVRDTMVMLGTDDGKILRVRAPVSGVVTSCGDWNAGASVRKGDVLLVIAPPPMPALAPAPAQGFGLDSLPPGVWQTLAFPLAIVPCCLGLVFLGDSLLARRRMAADAKKDKAIHSTEAERLLGGEEDEASVQPDGVDEIIAAGFTEAQARRALIASNGDVEEALDALLGEGSEASTSASAVRDLCSAADCSEEDARRALREADGDREAALALLLEGSRSTSSAVAELCEAAECSREQAERALRQAGGDREAALALLLEGSRMSSAIAELCDEAGCSEEDARMALRDTNGDREAALALLTDGSRSGSQQSTPSALARKVQILVHEGFNVEDAEGALARCRGHLDAARALILHMKPPSAPSRHPQPGQHPPHLAPAAGRPPPAPAGYPAGYAAHPGGHPPHSGPAGHPGRPAPGGYPPASAHTRPGGQAPHSAVAPPPAYPPRQHPPNPDEDRKVVQLVEAGFPEDRARQALRQNGGNAEDAMLALLAEQSQSSKASKGSKALAAQKAGGGTGSEDNKVSQLVEAGFTAEQARQALRKANGDVEEALMALIED